jgi:flagellar motor switch protein FliN/FliY
MRENGDAGMPGMEIADFADELSRSAEQATADLSLLDVPELSAPPQAVGIDPVVRDRGQESYNSLIMDIPVNLKIVLGTARMPVAAISKLVRGAIVKLDRRVGDPVDIFVNGRLLARGEVVVLDDGQSRFGVKLTEVGGLKSEMR